MNADFLWRTKAVASCRAKQIQAGLGGKMEGQSEGTHAWENSGVSIPKLPGMGILTPRTRDCCFVKGTMV